LRGCEHLRVARRNGVARGLLTVWRRQVAAAVTGKAASFVPIQIGAESGGGTAGASERIASAQARHLEITTPTKACGVVEIEVSGARIRIEPGVELARATTDMRGGMNSLALLVQEALRRDPHGGDLYVFRGLRCPDGRPSLPNEDTATVASEMLPTFDGFWLMFSTAFERLCCAERNACKSVLGLGTVNFPFTLN
jgi:transposase